jgi:phospholipase C
MMENRSFDHVLGYLSLPEYGGRGDVDGLVDLATDPRFASEYDQQIYRPFPMGDGRLRTICRTAGGRSRPSWR